MIKSPEARLQESCFQWFRLQYPSYFYLFFSIPNGGSRNIREAVNLKKTGVVAGVSDTFLAFPRNGYHGLFIEFKSGKNKLTVNQVQFSNTVISAGYQFEVIRSFDEFKDLIEKYIG